MHPDMRDTREREREPQTTTYYNLTIKKETAPADAVATSCRLIARFVQAKQAPDFRGGSLLSKARPEPPF